MIFGRYTSRQVAEKNLPSFIGSDHYRDWWTVREEAPPRHLPEYRYAVVFEPPTSAALVDLHSGQLECPRCHGDGEVGFNPSPVNDPQCEDTALCPDCHGSGLSERARSAAA